jgi:uncharacterized protein
MNRILYILLLLIIFVGCDTLSVEESSLLEIDGLYYQHDMKIPYSGKVYALSDNGEKLYSGNIENGLLVGDYEFYSADGRVKAPIDFEEMLVDRNRTYFTKDTNQPYSGYVFSFHPNGQKKSEGILLLGDGYKTWTSWYNNGQISNRGNLTKGQPSGVWTSWYHNGQVEMVVRYKNGQWDGICEWWYENGAKKREKNYVRGKSNGAFTSWHQNGKIQSIGTHTNDNPTGLWTIYHENGQKREEGVYLDLKKVGEWKYWDEIGKLKQK